MHCSKFILAVVAFSLGAVSLVSISLAISTDYWLLLFEEVKFQPDLVDDPSPILNETETKIMVRSKIGLFRFCVLTVLNEMYCEALPYTNIRKEGGKNDKQETTTAIAESQREATPVFLTGFFLIVCSTICNAVGNVRRNVLTLVAAVFYINAGLCIAVGMILYITFINDETSHAKKSEDLSFSYSYGWSAYLVGLCFFASEFAAVVCIKIFVKRFPSSEEKLRIVPGLERKLSVPMGHSNPTIIL